MERDSNFSGVFFLLAFAAHNTTSGSSGSVQRGWLRDDDVDQRTAGWLRCRRATVVFGILPDLPEMGIGRA